MGFGFLVEGDDAFRELLVAQAIATIDRVKAYTFRRKRHARDHVKPSGFTD